MNPRKFTYNGPAKVVLSLKARTDYARHMTLVFEFNVKWAKMYWQRPVMIMYLDGYAAHEGINMN